MTSEEINNQPGAEMKHELPEEPSTAEKLQADYNRLCALVTHHDVQAEINSKQRDSYREQLRKVVKKAENLPKKEIEALKKDSQPVLEEVKNVAAS